MRVMAFGTFDNFHPGHLSYLVQASRLGEELIVVVARDVNVFRLKGHKPLENEKLRLQNVQLAIKKITINSQAVLGSLSQQFSFLQKYQPDIIALGYDQKIDIDKLKNEIKKAGLTCSLQRLKAYQANRYKSSYCR